MTNDLSSKKLYRAGKGHVIGGVCAGVADYFNVDVNLVRILWLVFALINGLGAIVYLVCLLLIPKNPEHEKLPPQEQQRSPKAGLYLGVALVLIGLSFGFHTWFDLFWWNFPWFYWNINWHLVWPILLIVFGAWFIFQSSKKASSSEQANRMEKQPFRRSHSKRMIGGICGGLSDYLNIDVTIVRVAYVLLTLFTAVWLGVLAYVVMLIVVPEESLATQESETSKKPATQTKTASAAKSTTKKRTTKTTKKTETEEKPKQESPKKEPPEEETKGGENA